MTASSWASSSFMKLTSRRMPALLMQMSRRPNASRAACTIASPPSDVLTLSALATASPPASTISATTFSAAVGRAAGAVHRTAEVVDDHLGAAPGELEGVGAAQAAAGAGDERDATVEVDLHSEGSSP